MKKGEKKMKKKQKNFLRWPQVSHWLRNCLLINVIFCVVLYHAVQTRRYSVSTEYGHKCANSPASLDMLYETDDQLQTVICSAAFDVCVHGSLILHCSIFIYWKYRVSERHKSTHLSAQKWKKKQRCTEEHRMKRKLRKDDPEKEKNEQSH